MDTLTIVKLAVFLLASAGLTYVSRATLVAPRSHGFYRFFAWLNRFLPEGKRRG